MANICEALINQFSDKVVGEVERISRSAVPTFPASRAKAEAVPRPSQRMTTYNYGQVREVKN